MELRDKIINQFQLFIEDDTKLDVLNGVFDSMSAVNSVSIVSEEHYKIIEERRQKRLKGKTVGKSWEEVKLNLRQKYGF
ncbi:hypothetical protein SAMN05216503_2482 [Polaribacter sp. KT25b]|uniref:hypothetical protein n=1 Tax=Polaribacter sp. KT25b TaxID=1855336 RepID=UPI000879E527|nr:hypothetical protein [Polaribacter sp. KT25b]SDS25947.1 hypothetical protein SAMN05216503_2482 [Polaribacter sp. KT25b]